VIEKSMAIEKHGDQNLDNKNLCQSKKVVTKKIFKVTKTLTTEKFVVMKKKVVTKNIGN
jgi:hypothetical protein